KCIEACPTEAIIAPAVVDGSRCISYFTIELKEALSSDIKAQWQDWVFGCDICQDVCPWNRFSKPHTDQRLSYDSKRLDRTWEEWRDTTEEEFKQLTKGSALERPKWSGFMKNLKSF
ncbi:MAG: hypothetical protein RL062_800, partial [Bacteroidota bacterium]